MAVAQHHVSLQNISHVFHDDGRRNAQTGEGGLTALQDVSFDVPAGQFLSILGPSGCGKSTLLRIVGGLLKPSGGEVVVSGQGPARAQKQREIGLVFQDPALFPWRTVRQNVKLPLEIAGNGNGSIDPDALLELIGLRRFRDYYPHQLSGGMQQRVAIARALAFDPSLLLMDEPFGALDEITRSQMRYELLRIWSSTAGRKSVVFVTHSISEALAMSDRVIVLSGRPGRVAGDIDVELERPRTIEVERSPAFLDYADHLRGLLETPA